MVGGTRFHPRLNLWKLKTILEYLIVFPFSKKFLIWLNLNKYFNFRYSLMHWLDIYEFNIASLSIFKTYWGNPIKKCSFKYYAHRTAARKGVQTISNRFIFVIANRAARYTYICTYIEVEHHRSSHAIIVYIIWRAKLTVRAIESLNFSKVSDVYFFFIFFSSIYNVHHIHLFVVYIALI